MLTKSQIFQLEAIKRVRKPMTPPSRYISTKKGKKGYSRRREKEILWEEVIEHLKTRND